MSRTFLFTALISIKNMLGKTGSYKKSKKFELHKTGRMLNVPIITNVERIIF